MGPATPIYAAPEQLINKKSMISPRTDFFLLALLALELLHGYHPFDPTRVGNEEPLIKNISTGAYVPPPEDCNEMLGEFIEQNLSPRPFHRMRLPKHLTDHLGLEGDPC
jgi:serine/threonine protein kinase